VSNPAFWVALIAMLVGLAGTVVPVLPGIGLIWAAALAYALIERFSTIGPYTLAALSVLAVLGIGADLVISQAGSRVAGASWKAVAAGLVLGVAGTFVGLMAGGLGAIPMGIVGALIGVVGVEYLRRRSMGHALKAGGGWLAGCLVSRAFQFMIAAVMIALFVWQAVLVD
jgi:uncharacterized protein YqgC (DUF456 family)